MKHILFFGFGFSAQALAARLPRDTWRVSGTSRSQEGVDAITALGFEGIRFADLAAIPASVSHIVSSVPPDSEGDPVVRRFASDLSRPFTYVAYLSTTGVYGDHDGAWIDEDTPLTPNAERGRRRLEAERDWLTVQPATHVFRLAGIYGPGRNALESLLDGTARRIIKPGQVFSRIHVEDIAGIVLASMAHPHPGRAYNVADDEPCPPQDVIAHGAQLLGLPVPPDIPFAEAELSPMARSFYADSKRVSNARVREELGYAFQFPNYRVGLASLLADLRAKVRLP